MEGHGGARNMTQYAASGFRTVSHLGGLLGIALATARPQWTYEVSVVATAVLLDAWPEVSV